MTEEFDLTETALRAWVNRAEADEGKGTGWTLTAAERSELIDLRKRLKRADTERDILEKALASLQRWAVSANNERALALSALDRATSARAPGVGLVHHSDRGSVYV